MKRSLLFLIWIYRKFISPLKPACCRFYPTCSCYAMDSISRHGALRGGFLAVIRLLKCHPFHPGGYDPVPDEFRLFRQKQEPVLAVEEHK